MARSGSVKSYAVIGAGALGGYYGARLHHAGLDVHFLLRGDYDHVAAHGLKVEATQGDFSIAQPNIYRAARDMPRCDVALIGLKSTANAALPDILPHVLKNDGTALLMQNGLGIEETIAPLLCPSQAIVAGLAFLCSHKVGPGHIRHLDYEQVRLGEYTPDGKPLGVTPRMLCLADDFRRAKVEVVLEDDLLLARWKKLVWNVPYNGLSVTLGETTEGLMKNPDTRALCIALMREVVAGAAGFGRTIHEDFVQQMIAHTDKMVAYLPSMRLDYDGRRPMELEAIYGNPLRAAASRGVAMPRVEELYRELCLLESLSVPLDKPLASANNT